MIVFKKICCFLLFLSLPHRAEVSNLYYSDPMVKKPNYIVQENISFQMMKIT